MRGGEENVHLLFQFGAPLLQFRINSGLQHRSHSSSMLAPRVPYVNTYLFQVWGQEGVDGRRVHVVSGRKGDARVDPSFHVLAMKMTDERPYAELSHTEGILKNEAIELSSC